MDGSPSLALADMYTVDLSGESWGCSCAYSCDPCSSIVLYRLSACPAYLNLHRVLGKKVSKCLLFTSAYMLRRDKARSRLLGWSRLLLLLSGKA